MDRDIYSKIIAKIKSITEKINALSGSVTGVEEDIGTLSELTTTEKGSLVGAINEVDSDIGTLTSNQGTLSSLETTEKGSLVGAINELKGVDNKFQFLAYEITGSSDSDVIAEACSNILTAIGSAGAFQVQAMRTGAHMIMGWGVIRNSILFGQFQAYNGTSNNIYVCSYDSTNGISIVRTI